jgi:single-strand DNA-binding protein
MGDLSVAVIVGRLTRDAELKYTPSGQAVCHFSVATSSRVKRGDQWVDESSFWDVDLWGKRAESVNQYLTKGKLVALQGDMRQDKWEQDGQGRMKVKITASDVQLLGSSQGEARGGQDGETHARAPANAPAARPAAPVADQDFTDDVPFD